jgi:membrane peptidoglycan carboxypeptidase
MGITTFTEPERYGLSLTLGGGDVKLLDMMSVYGTFSQLGLKHEIKGVLKITDPNGTVLEDNSEDSGLRVLAEGPAFMIADILSDPKARIPAFGEKSKLEIPGHTVAVKTGTTDSKRDNWTFGYTPKYVVGVWVGNNDNSPMNQFLASGVTGAAPIWNKIMTNIIKDKPNVAFLRPSDIKEGMVGGKKDLILVGDVQKTPAPEKSEAKASVLEDLVKRDQDRKTESNITFTDPLSTFQSDQSGETVVRTITP